LLKSFKSFKHNYSHGILQAEENRLLYKEDTKFSLLGKVEDVGEDDFSFFPMKQESKN